MSDWVTVQGDSTDIKTITVDGVTDYTDYSGKLLVLNGKQTGIVEITIPAIVPDLVNGFTVGFTPGQTDSLAVGTYVVAFEITKVDAESIPIYRRELSWSMRITQSVIPTV